MYLNNYTVKMRKAITADEASPENI